MFYVVQISNNPNHRSYVFGPLTEAEANTEENKRREFYGNYDDGYDIFVAQRLVKDDAKCRE